MKNMGNLLLTATIFFISLFVTPANARVAYLTDVEGSYEKFRDFIDHNENFYWGADGKRHLLPEHHFVFGGDAVDRANGSIRIVSELLRLKKESGSKVVFIVGNRDASKVRIASELPTLDLKSILAKKLGAPNGFEFHREEMAILQGIPVEQVTDEMVTRDYLHWISPEGQYTKFLESAQLAHRIENTIFLHSGVTKSNFGFVPGSQLRSKLANEWMGRLNVWYWNQITQWKLRPASGMNLIDYMMPVPGFNQNPWSVVTGRNNDELNNPFLPPEEIIEALLDEGMERLMIGHTPVGQTPLVLRWRDRFEIIIADNSYAANEANAHQINLKGHRLRVATFAYRMKGVAGLDNVSFSHPIDADTAVGMRFSDGMLVAAPVDQGYLATKLGKGFKPEYQVIPYTQAFLRGFSDPIAVPEVGCGLSVVTSGRSS